MRFGLGTSGPPSARDLVERESACSGIRTPSNLLCNLLVSPALLGDRCCYAHNLVMVVVAFSRTRCDARPTRMRIVRASRCR